MEKLKIGYSAGNVESTFYDDALRPSIFWFFPLKYYSKTRKSIKHAF
jgi:hypothetical protein